MEKKNVGYLVAIFALAIAVVGMSIGFAFTDINLQIKGDKVTTKAASWDVHFDSTSLAATANSNVTASTPIATSDTTHASYAVTLEKPGDKYEFTIKAKNYGTFDAKLSAYALTASPSLPTGDSYIAHTLKYNGNVITPGDISGTTLAPGASDTYTVTVEYLKPTDAANLPSEDVEYTFTIDLTYTEAN